MNIDKFGHHVHKRLRFSEYIDTLNDTLVRTESGDFDLKLSKLKGLISPEESDEAVNKAYLDKELQDLRDEMKNILSNVKTYLSNLEKLTSERLISMFYSKSEIDHIIKTKIAKNE